VKNLLTYLILLIVVAGCTPKNNGWICGTGLLMSESEHWIDSKITVYETIEITDTTLITIKGLITCISQDSSETYIPNLINVNVLYKLTTESEYLSGISSDSLGNYQIILNSGEYDFKFAYLGFNLLEINNILLGTGEITLLNVQLGEGFGANKYIILDNGKIKKLK
jgi:hypothetical protein